MTEPWELTDEDIGDIVAATSTPQDVRGNTIGRAIATAAVQKYRAHLASQCGPDPCVGCDCNLCERYTRKGFVCASYHRYLGQLSERAKCEAERDQLAKDVGDWIMSFDETEPAFRIQDAWDTFLASKGIGRP